MLLAEWSGKAGDVSRTKSTFVAGKYFAIFLHNNDGEVKGFPIMYNM